MMEILMNKQFDSNIANQIMTYRGPDIRKDDLESKSISDVEIKLVSKNRYGFSSMRNYFKIEDKITQTKRFHTFVNETEDAQIWKTNNGDYMMGVDVSKTEKSQLKGSYTVDLKFARYSDYNHKHLCYNIYSKNMNMREKKTSCVKTVVGPFDD